MTSIIHINVPGEPGSFARPRWNPRARVMFNTNKHQSKKEDVRAGAIEAMAGRPPVDGGIEVQVVAWYPRPKSKTWKTKPNHPYPKTSRPDVDNVGKLVLDALEGVVYRNDAQVCDLILSKRVCAGPSNAKAEQKPWMQSPHVRIIASEVPL